MPFMLNSVHVAGNLTRDPEHKQVGQGNVCSFGLAINRRYKNKAGEMQEETTFVEIEVWSRQAELSVLSTWPRVATVSLRDL